MYNGKYNGIRGQQQHHEITKPLLVQYKYSTSRPRTVPPKARLVVDNVGSPGTDEPRTRSTGISVLYMPLLVRYKYGGKIKFVQYVRVRRTGRLLVHSV